MNEKKGGRKILVVDKHYGEESLAGNKGIKPDDNVTFVMFPRHGMERLNDMHDGDVLVLGDVNAEDEADALYERAVNGGKGVIRVAVVGNRIPRKAVEAVDISKTHRGNLPYYGPVRSHGNLEEVGKWLDIPRNVIGLEEITSRGRQDNQNSNQEPRNLASEVSKMRDMLGLGDPLKEYEERERKKLALEKKRREEEKKKHARNEPDVIFELKLGGKVFWTLTK